MAVIVQKYGGSSVATIEKIKNVARLLVKKKNEGNSVVAVVSAMGDTTDNLVKLAKDISNTPDKRELDALLSTGEMVSASLISMAIKEIGEKCISYTAYQVGIKTNGVYGKSLIDSIECSKIQKSLSEGNIVIVAGFQGISENGDITTLGRGGSDTSAVALAVQLNAVCEIYTDVEGIYSVDPRKYKNAKKLDVIDYEEMLELSSVGAGVMHSRSIELAEKYKIPVYVALNSGDKKGTYIKEANDMGMESKIITGLATSDDDVAVTLKDIDFDINIISTLFSEIANKRINIDMISQTAPMNGKVNVSFTLPKEELKDCMNIINKYSGNKNIAIDENITKFSVVGIGMKTTSGVAAKIFKLFSDNKIEVKMITTSEIRITCAIKQSDKAKAIEIVAEQFNL
ncbi:aspartate kinase [Haloimpatiens sp. FM7330]|uniref:aspartate kinase n=1 Tax=Haloimpatiens sp. FM7330 TaxID=3298610 RepID=UPI00362D785B